MVVGVGRSIGRRYCVPGRQQDAPTSRARAGLWHGNCVDPTMKAQQEEKQIKHRASSNQATASTVKQRHTHIHGVDTVSLICRLPA